MSTRSSWTPRAATGAGPLYRRVAEALQEDISGGRLAPGIRLPTHRQLARELGTTVVTASRAYREAAQRGLLQGEVGRGTFVAARTPVGAAAGPWPDQGAEAGVLDLTASYIVVGAEELGLHRRMTRTGRTGWTARTARALGETRTDRPVWMGEGAGRLWERLNAPLPPGGGPEHRAAGAAWLRHGSLAPGAHQVLATSGAQHGIVVALAALTRPGDLLFAEAFTYPGLKTAARHLNLRVEPVAVDRFGLVPEALAELCAKGPGGVLYCQPTLHNPTSAVMPLERRRQIAALARRHDLALIEDNAYGFLLDDPPPPLAALAPERTCHLVSCSKSIAPGLRVGFVLAPEALVPRLQAEISATSLFAAPAMLELAARWIEDGTAERIALAKRREAERRQEMARARFAGLRFATHPASSHLWLELPPPWRTALFVEQARRRGVAVNPAEPFVLDQQAAPQAVRVCLGPERDRQRLDSGLRTLAEILASPPPPEPAVV